MLDARDTLGGLPGLIDCILQLTRDHHIEPARVKRIRLGVLSGGALLVADPIEQKRAPQSIVDAQFSAPYAAAVALVTAVLVFAPVTALTWDVRAGVWPFLIASGAHKRGDSFRGPAPGHRCECWKHNSALHPCGPRGVQLRYTPICA